ncbi:hypothetical protein PC116_g34177, partial [Phytophthora cactorum]
GITAWINLDPEPTGADLKNCWDLVVQGKCDDVASLVHLPRYDESIDETMVIDEKKFKENVRGIKLEVEIRKTTPEAGASVKGESRDASPIGAKPQPIENVQGMPTPSASPKVRAALPVAKPVPKQSKLSFNGKSASTTTGPVPKDTKKTTKRKPRQTKKAEPKPPKATISTTFKATKASTTISSKLPAKREFESEPE